MRFYVFTPGTPGYIAAEVAVRELFEDTQEARAWANDTWIPWWSDSARIIDRAEALMVPLYREALERWEAGDDTTLQETEVAEVRAGRRGTAALEAAEGCRVATAALAADDDELISDAVLAHAHAGCGWSFPDEPKERRLNVVR
jgi:hypothetical protein